MNTPMVQRATAPTNTVVEQLSLLELFHTLMFRRRLLFSTALLLITLGVIALYQVELRYSATSAMVGLPKSNVVAIEEVLNIGLGNDNDTEVEVLRSRELARKVIEKLNLRSNEVFNPGLRPPSLLSHINPVRLVSNWLKKLMEDEPAAPPSDEEKARREMVTAIDILLADLTISTVRSSRVINVSFESTNPVMAATIANELPESYIIGRMEAKLEATEKATRWLNEKLSEMKVKVEKSERAVELYRTSHDLTEVQGDSSILSTHLSEVNKQLILAKAELAQFELRMQQIKKLQSQGDSAIESAKEVMSSNVIQKLREQEATLTRKASELSVKFGPKHNRIKQVNAEIKDVRGKIDLEIKRVVVAQENELEVAQRRVESLGKSLQELENQSGEQTKEAIALHSLEREAAANRTLFETFLNRFKETASTAGMVEADVRVISKAEIPRRASFPNKKKMLVLIIMGSFVAAIILVFLVQGINQSLLTPEQVEKELDLAAIGIIPFIHSKNVHDYILEKPQSSFAEALNTLKTSLILSSPDQAVKVLQFTSSVPQEGKSTLSIAFARLLAKAGNKVILLDGDLRRGSLQKKLGISATTGKGLTDLVMTSGGSIEEFVIKDEDSDAYIMLSGDAEFINATDIFSSHRMHDIIGLLKENFDYVIVDSPPVMAVSDARIIATLVDKTVFVVQWDKTPRKVIKAAVQLLKDGNADIAGCVLNQVDLQRYASSLSYGGSGYYYQHSHYGDYYTN